MLISSGNISYKRPNSIYSIGLRKSFSENSKTQIFSPVCDSVSFGKGNFLTHQKEEIFKSIENSVKHPSNFLGEGSEAAVYRIEGTNYCVRLPHSTPGDLKVPIFDAIKTDFNLNISPQDKINHTVAKLGGGATIMPVLNGFNYFAHNTCKKEVAQMVEELPQSTYDDFFSQICEAKKLGMRFDVGYKNILIDPVQKKIICIDFYEDSGGTVMSSMYHPLVYDGVSTSKQQKLCAGKIFYAVLNDLKAGHQPSFDPYSYGVCRFVNNLAAKNLIESDSYKRLLSAGMKDLMELKYQELKGLDVRCNIEGSQKFLRALVKQLFFQ